MPLLECQSCCAEAEMTAQVSSAEVGQRLSSRGADITLCTQTSQSRTTGVCHSWDFYLILEAVETQSLGRGGVAVHFPVGMNLQGTNLLQVQAETHPAFRPHGWAEQFGNLVWEEREIATCALPLTQSREGMGAEWQCAGGSAASPGAAELWSLQSRGQETDVDKWSFSTIPNLCVSYFPAPAPPRLPLLPYWSH